MTVISIENTNISFSDIKNAYKNSNDTNASQNSSLRDGYTTTEISLSDFRNASFVKGNNVPSSGAISINTYFKGKTFGSLNKNFEGQSPSTSTGDWTPTNDHSGWENGSGAVNGTYWGLISNKNVKGWNLDNSGSTGSGGTGPSQAQSGGYYGEYLYTEVSSSRHAYCFVLRLPGIKFSTVMDNTINDLDLKFYVHAYGSQIGDLYVYIDDSSTSNHSSATLLASYTTFSGFTSNSSPWQQKTISLNSYRTSSNHQYIYIVSQNATGYAGDLSLDTFSIEETTSGGGGGSF